MTATVFATTVDCRDAQALAGFWSTALGLPVDEGASPYFATINVRGDSMPRLMFAAVPESKQVKNRVHLDLAAQDRPAEIDRLVAAGATRVADKDEWGHSWTVMTDPEGNEFCISGPVATT